MIDVEERIIEAMGSSFTSSRRALMHLAQELATEHDTALAEIEGLKRHVWQLTAELDEALSDKERAEEDNRECRSKFAVDTRIILEQRQLLDVLRAERTKAVLALERAGFSKSPTGEWDPPTNIEAVQQRDKTEELYSLIEEMHESADYVDHWSRSKEFFRRATKIYGRQPS